MCICFKSGEKCSWKLIWPWIDVMRLSITPLSHWIFRQEIAKWRVCLIWLSILISIITSKITLWYQDVIKWIFVVASFFIFKFHWGLYFVYIWIANGWFYFGEMEFIFIFMNESASTAKLAILSSIHTFLVFWQWFEFLLTVCKNTIITALTETIHIILT